MKTLMMAGVTSMYNALIDSPNTAGTPSPLSVGSNQDEYFPPFLPLSTCFSWTVNFDGTCAEKKYNTVTRDIECDSFGNGPDSCYQLCCLDAIGFEGWDYTAPTNVFWTGDTCDDYRAYDVNWLGFEGDLLSYLGQSDGELGPEKIPYKRIAAMLVRAAFHDAGAYNATSKKGGADGSFLLAEKEQRYAGNNIKFGFAAYVRAALNPLVSKYKCSWGDAIAVAGAVGARFLGYSNKFHIDVGRCDSTDANPDVLPAFASDFNQFVEYYNSVGLSIQEGTALMGSHSVIQDGKGPADGVQQYFWSNKYYSDLFVGKMAVTFDKFLWSAGSWQYTANDANIRPNDIDPSCPFLNVYKQIQLKYVQDEEKWNVDYALSYRKMCNINAKVAKDWLCTIIVGM